MKKIFLFLLFIISVFNINAQTKTVVSGRILNTPENTKAVVVRYKDFITFDTENNSGELDKNGNFKISLIVKQPVDFRLVVNDEMTPLFLEPGDSLYLTLDYKQFDETIKYSGKGESNNNFLAQHYLKFENDDSGLNRKQRMEFNAATYFHYSDSVFNEEIKYIDQLKSKLSSVFYESWKANRAYEIASEKLNYWHSHLYVNGAKKLTFDCSEGDYSFLNEIKIQNDSLIEASGYCSFINAYLNYKYQQVTCHTTMAGKSFYEQNYYLTKVLFTGKSRDFLLAWCIHNMISYGNLKTAEKLFEEYKINSENYNAIQLLTDEFAKAAKLAPGNPAPAFTLKNLEGKDISLSDYKGKVVYLDFWASWCSPCKAEIPSAAKMEDELKNRDVVFLKVSIDENEMSWRKIIEEKKLSGVHVIANGFNDPVPKSYQVDGIPKYVLIDKNGNLVDSNAPRPSSEKEIIDKILAELQK